MQEISSLRSSSVCLRTSAGLPRPHLGALKLQEEKQSCVRTRSFPSAPSAAGAGPPKAHGADAPNNPERAGPPRGRRGCGARHLPMSTRLWEEKIKNECDPIQKLPVLHQQSVSRLWFSSTRQVEHRRPKPLGGGGRGRGGEGRAGGRRSASGAGPTLRRRAGCCWRRC